MTDLPNEAVEAAIALGEERTGRPANRKLFTEIVEAAAPGIRKQERERVREALVAMAEELEDVPPEFSAPAAKHALSGAWTLRKFLDTLEDSDA